MGYSKIRCPYNLLAPMDEYAASKAAADLALGAMTYRGLRCVRFRPFNHSGPGQAEGFVVPDFAAQIARIEPGLAQPVMEVGNFDVERDFLDVRDVADAYVLAVQKAETVKSGAIFNIASGIPRRVGHRTGPPDHLVGVQPLLTFAEAL